VDLLFVWSSSEGPKHNVGWIRMRDGYHDQVRVRPHHPSGCADSTYIRLYVGEDPQSLSLDIFFNKKQHWGQKVAQINSVLAPHLTVS
jgi:hypothetical protein